MKKAWLAGILMLAASPLALSHTVAVGTINAGAPGSVTVWLGSYHSPSQLPAFEGSMTLNGVTQAFNISSSTLPAGLIVGANYFYADCNFCGVAGGFNNPLTNQFPVPAGLPQRWQGVTFTGLAAGTYSYTISGMGTQIWRDWNSGLTGWTGSLVIPRSSVAPTPEPGTLALLGLGLLGMGVARRRRSA